MHVFHDASLTPPGGGSVAPRPRYRRLVLRAPSFVPWCVGSRVLKHETKRCEAELEIGFKLLSEKYLSHVEVCP